MNFIMNLAIGKLFNWKLILSLWVISCFPPQLSSAQEIINQELIDAEKMLLFSPLVQMEATSAVNDMYNFKFKRAANQFQWFREKYPNHPLPYFLLGLNEWWQMMPNMDVEQHDDAFFEYMDASIDRARDLYQEDKENIEASFFLAAAYAFKSRLNAERKNWTKAVFNGKSSLKFLRRGIEINQLNPELMFGEALYNYYSVWIPQNYPLLKPVLLFFKKGDQELGLKQLQEVAENAFYTRTEAQYFLMRIYRNEEKAPLKALPIAEYLHETFPDNAYFARYYGSVVFSLGMFDEMEEISHEILQKIEADYPGYEGVSGRYAAYYMAYLQRFKYRNLAEAEKYYRKTIAFAEATEHYQSGYYRSALVEMARISHQKGEIKEAKTFYELVKKYTKRKAKVNKEARKYLRKYKKY